MLNALLEIQQLLLDDSNLDHCLAAILPILGQIARVERVCWFDRLTSADQEVWFLLQDQWVVPPCPRLSSQEETLKHWPKSWQIKMAQGKVISIIPALGIGIDGPLPPTVQLANLQNALILPLTMQGQSLGYLRCDHVVQGTEVAPLDPVQQLWDQEVINLLQLASQAITLRLAQLYSESEPHALGVGDRFFLQSTHPCCIADFNGYFQAVNPAWLVVTGHSTATLTTSPFLDFVHPDDRAHSQAAQAMLVAGQNIIPWQNRYRCADDSYRWLEWNAVSDTEAQVIYAIARDITAQKELEILQQESQQRLEAAQALANVGDWELDLITGRTTWSRQLFEIFGLSPGIDDPESHLTHSAAGMLQGQYFHAIHPEDRAMVEATIQNAINHGKGYELDHRIICPDGTLRYLLVRGQPILNDRGQVTRLFGTALDITHQKAVEHHLNDRFALEQLITTISTQFINLDWADIDREIETALGKIGEFTQVDRSYVCQLEGLKLRHSHVWLNPDLDHPQLLCDAIPTTDLPWLMAQLQKLEVITVPSVAQLPTAAALEQAHWQQQKIHALIAVPIISQGELIGFLGLDAIQKPRSWEGEDVALLQLVGEIFANAMQREKIESALSESEARFRQLAENIQSVFWMADPISGQFLYVSPAYETIWQQSCADLYQNPHIYQQVVHPEDQDMFEVFLAQQKQEACELEYRIVRLGGEVRWIRDRAFPIRNVAGVIYRITGIAEDISTHKFTEAALQVLLKNTAAKIGKDFFRALAKQLAAVLNVRFAVISAAVDQPPTRAQTLAIWEGSDFQNDFEYDLAHTPCAFVARGQVCVYPNRVQTAFPQDDYFVVKRIVSYAGMPLKDANDQVLGHLAIMDTKPLYEPELPLLILQIFATRAGAELERLVAEQERRRSEERLQLAVDGSSLGLWDRQPQQNTAVHNQRYWQMLGYEIGNPFDTDEGWRELVHPEDLPIMTDQLERHIAGETPVYQAEFRMRHRDGHWVWIASHGKVFDYDAQGKPLRITGTHMDITDRKEMERIKDELISVISHELRTPMTSLHGSLKLLLTGKLGQLTPQGQQMLEIAVRNTDRLNRLVNDILDLQRLKAKQSQFRMEAWDVEGLLREAIASQNILALDQHITLAMAPFPDPLTLWGDRDYLLQVLINLINNGIKFSPPQSSIHLAASHYSTSHLVISVRDQGRGIPAAQLPIIFDRFRQGDGSDVRQIGGTGLGLAICRQVVEQHGGEIWVDTVVGEGSTFAFTVPMASL
ncbi:MAG: PAS domain S-box protein [Spirulina sp. DLM2.Bin59]|nr:MAG: PAS domain S-box protein [Spirulina sp. DLM2.Bin59]